MDDLFLNSRRTKFYECYYWKKSKVGTNSLEDYKLEDQMVVVNDRIDGNSLSVISSHLEKQCERIPLEGIFWAKQMGAKSNSSNIIAGSFMFDTSSVTIETTDDISTMEKDDLVFFNEDFYRVALIQDVPIRQVNEFSLDIPTKYILRLMK